MINNMAFKPRRNLTKVLEEAEDEKQSPRNTNKKPMAPPSIKGIPYSALSSPLWIKNFGYWRFCLTKFFL